jgi:hypothetical protein
MRVYVLALDGVFDLGLSAILDAVKAKESVQGNGQQMCVIRGLNNEAESSNSTRCSGPGQR